MAWNKKTKLLVAYKLKCKHGSSKVRVKIHKSVQNPVKYDKHAIGVFKSDNKVVDCTPVKVSNLIDNFLEIAEEKNVSAAVADQRKREVGPVIPAKYSLFTKDLKTATILQQENILYPSRPNRGRREKIKLNFYFRSSFCGPL